LKKILEKEKPLVLAAIQKIEAKEHYPVPIYRQPALNYLGHMEGYFPVTDAHTYKIITFPCDQHLSQKEMDYVIQTVTDFYRKSQ
jgi:dTDP-3-amino-2,3,6-trideoxy-4-keto-D-glucose/dTDP-3-amino-3,4,6-trideoxy-alpha-D-glucose/dTDP-2,6-dideoxy-D-kanosamine transaminase